MNTAPTFFFGDGLVRTDFGWDPSVGRSLLVQDDGKLVEVGASGNQVAVARYNANGTLDTSFSSDGMLLLSNITSPYGSALQADGKIVVAGTCSGLPALTRINADGSVDTGFGAGGTVSSSQWWGYGTSVAVQPDGKIVLVGNTDSFGGKIVIARFNADGSADSAFGSNGELVFDSASPRYEQGVGVVVEPDGQILIVGSVSSDIALLRLNANGTVDSAFAASGMAMANFNGAEEGKTALLQSDGKIVVVGGNQSDIELVRYGGDGVLDSGFGTSGTVVTDFAAKNFLCASAVLQADGKILVLGSLSDSSHYDSDNWNGDSYFLSLVRYNADGSLDSSFGNNGIATGEFGHWDGMGSWTSTFGYGLAVQDDGKIVVTGSDGNRYGRDVPVVRFNSDGTVDSGFDSVLTNNSLSDVVTYTESGAAVILDSSVHVYDAELSSAGNYAGASVTLSRHGGASADDVFAAAGNLGALQQGGELTLSGVDIGTVTTNSQGILSLTFNGSATQARVDQALSSIAYANTGTSLQLSSVQIDWAFNDGNTGGQGTGGALDTTGISWVTTRPGHNYLGNSLVVTGQSFDLSHDVYLAVTSVGQQISGSFSSNQIVIGGNATYTGSFYYDEGAIYEYSTIKSYSYAHAYTGFKLDFSYGLSVWSYFQVAGNSTSFLEYVLADNDTLVGGAGADHLFGLTGNDSLSGGAGSDTLEGNDGLDVIDGGAGADVMVGGAGSDTYIVDNLGDTITEQPIEGIDLVKVAILPANGTFSLASNLENAVLTNTVDFNLTGNALNNVLNGNSAANVLDGGAGADTLIGGLGNDTYVVDNAGDRITELANQGVDTVRTCFDATLAGSLANLENLVLLGAALNGTGNGLANLLTGNANANSLVGGAGNDSLDGGSGTDTLIGGTGDDTYTMDNLGDVITELAGEGNDTLIITASAGSPIVYTAPDNIETIKLGEGSANIALATNGLTQVAATTGIDSIVFTGGGAMTLGAGIENLTLSQATGNIGGTGGADNNLLEGNSGANLLDGGAGNDTLKGYAGEDILLGGSGNDLLNGGKGADRLEGGIGDDTYVIDNSGDQIIEALGAGTDTVRSSLRSTTLGDNLENLILEGTAKANGIGNALNNQLTGNGKANCLTGGAGADTFIFNTALGPLNVDTLTDFTTGQDKIALDDSIFSTLSGASSTWYHSVTSLAQTDADDHILYDQGTGALYYDADGAGGAAAIRFAMLSGAPTLSAADLQVV